jgi:hypothetical protein
MGRGVVHFQYWYHIFKCVCVKKQCCVSGLILVGWIRIRIRIQEKKVGKSEDISFLKSWMFSFED